VAQDEELTVFEEIDLLRQSTVTHSIVIVAEWDVAAYFEGEFVDQLMLLQALGHPSMGENEEVPSDRLKDFDRQRAQQRFLLVANE
jgi:hypothetical protein